ncbi:MAG: N-formylglutamate amidohydrolase [Anaerolineae bacterium]|nr:N-formylglutamate amidohydrolase [Anaerolineae bacterium]
MRKLPIAIILPHAGWQIPSELEGRVALSPEQIFNEADAYTDLIYAFQDRVQHWLCFPYARAILDVNRLAGLAINRPGDGIVKWQTSYGDPVYYPGHYPDEGLEQQLIEQYWRPWHEQLESIAADPEVKLVIDAHSMAATGPGQYDDPGKLRPRLALCNYGDLDGGPHPDGTRLTAPKEIMEQFAAAFHPHIAQLTPLVPTGPVIALNTPFRGGADIALHGGYEQPWIMVEISRALYVGEQSGRAPIIPPDESRIAQLREAVWQALSELL